MPYSPCKFLSDTYIETLVKECASIHAAANQEEKQGMVAKCLQAPLLGGTCRQRIVMVIHTAYSKTLQTRPIRTVGRPRKGRDAFIPPLTIDCNIDLEDPSMTQMQKIEVARQAQEREQDRLEKQWTAARERRKQTGTTQHPVLGEHSHANSPQTTASLLATFQQDIYCEKTAPTELQRMLSARSRGRPTASDTAARRMVMKDYWVRRGYTGE
jgi:hypothetical protein